MSRITAKHKSSEKKITKTKRSKKDDSAEEYENTGSGEMQKTSLPKWAKIVMGILAGILIIAGFINCLMAKYVSNEAVARFDASIEERHDELFADNDSEEVQQTIDIARKALDNSWMMIIFNGIVVIAVNVIILFWTKNDRLLTKKPKVIFLCILSILFSSTYMLLFAIAELVIIIAMKRKLPEDFPNGRIPHQVLAKNPFRDEK